MKRKKAKKPKSLKRSLIKLGVCLCVIAILFTSAYYILGINTWADLTPEKITDIQESLRIYDKNGKLRSRPQNTQYYFRESGSWSLISSSVAAFRYKPYGHIFDVAGMSFFSDDNLYFLLGLCNSVYTMQVLAIVAPTINYQCGDIANIPVKLVLKENVEKKVSDNILLSRNDWDSFETSWDFKKHPMI